MDYLTTALLGLMVLLVVLWLVCNRPKDGLPPGPRGLPLLGYYPFLGELPFVTMANLSRKYGKVFSLPLLGHRTVVLNDWTSIKEAFVHQGDTFSSRPPTVVSEILIKGADVAFATDLIAWKERRKFTLQQLKTFGFGRKSMEGVIIDEISQLLTQWEKLDHQKIVMDNTFFYSFMNIIWAIVANKRFDHGDQSMVKFSGYMDAVFHGLTSGSAANLILALRHLPGSKFGEFQRAYHKTDAFLTKVVDEHIESYQEGQTRDFIDAFLAEMDKHRDPADPVGRRSFQKKHLNAVMMDLFFGGIDTGNNTLTWALLYMITWPEIQRKVQQEMDIVVGRARLPTFEDRKMLPYTEAVLLEVHRFATIAPLSLIHSTVAQAKLFGYVIPKSTVVFENIWAVHHDPDLWGDPEVFRPKRFLKDDGSLYKPEYLIPFSVGSRMCLGEGLARMEMFLFFTALLHRFSLSMVPGQDAPSLEPLVRVTLKPKPFPLLIKCR